MGAEAGRDAALRVEDGIEDGALLALRADHLGEPASGSESEAGIAAFRAEDGTGDEPLLGLLVRRVEETFAELRLEVEPAAALPVGGSIAVEIGNGTLMALGARCSEEGTTGI